MRSLSKPRAESVFYYCDESGHMTDRFCTFGGIAIADYDVARIGVELNNIKKDLGIRGEIKWGNTSGNGRDRGQLAYARYLAKLVHNREIHLHIKFTDFDDYDHKLSGPAHRFDTVGRQYFHLLLFKPIAYYGHLYKLHIRPDDGECTKRLEAYLSNINERAQRQFKTLRRGCVESVKPLNSHSQPLLQLLDVTLGAFSKLKNKRPVKDAKENLANLVWELYGRPDLAVDIDKRQKWFSIWDTKRRKNWQPQIPELLGHS